MNNSNHQRSTIALALLTFANLDRKEEQEFIATMNVLLRASPGRRQQMVNQIRQDAYRGNGVSELAVGVGSHA